MDDSSKRWIMAIWFSALIIAFVLGAIALGAEIQNLPAVDR